MVPNGHVSSLDRFASVFNAADKVAFNLALPAIDKALVVTDLAEPTAKSYLNAVKNFLGVLDGVHWSLLHGSDFRTVKELLERVEEHQPDVLITYRHLHSEAWRWPYSLGEHLDVLIQVVAAPVIVLPHPDEEGMPEHTLGNTDLVMSISPHLKGDDRLVNYAVLFTRPDGLLLLAHVEDDRVLGRYMEAIAKIPQIDTDTAHKEIRRQLLKEPGEYMDACQAVLAAEGLPVRTEKLVAIGHRLEQFRVMIEKHKVNLLVLHARSGDQRAMESLAYTLAVEYRNLPLLLV